MARSTHPLKILIHHDWDGEGWVSELRQKGHTVHTSQTYQDHLGTPLGEYDLILMPKACRFLPGMEPFLPTILKGVRAVKYKGVHDDN